jgi:oligoendopeptidase F
VLLSYSGEPRDVMTLAHELGHGVHDVLAKDCGLLEQQAPLTAAETASVFGEMLVFRALMREEPDPRARLALLCGKLEDAFATVFRQVVLTRFEEKLHAARRGEGELPIERINALWLEANAPMHGDAVALSDDYAWWWLYIGHFVHEPFYCYAYAFGELLVLALLRRYDEEGAPFVAKYRALLAAGGSEAPSTLLARIGLDVTDPRFWDGGIAVIERMLAEAEELAAATAPSAARA